MSVVDSGAENGTFARDIQRESCHLKVTPGQMTKECRGSTWLNRVVLEYADNERVSEALKGVVRRTSSSF